VGSVKAPVVEAIAPLWPNFIGGHPMAGTADSGIEAAVPDLFALKPCVYTSSNDTGSGSEDCGKNCPIAGPLYIIVAR